MSTEKFILVCTKFYLFSQTCSNLYCLINFAIAILFVVFFSTKGEVTLKIEIGTVRKLLVRASSLYSHLKKIEFCLFQT